MITYILQHPWMTFWLILFLAYLLDHVIMNLCNTSYKTVAVICYTLKGKTKMDKPDLVYTLTNQQLAKVEEALKENGFDASQTAGTITHDGVTIAYTIEPVNFLNKVSIEIEKHALFEPKTLIIGKLQKLFSAVPAS